MSRAAAALLLCCGAAAVVVICKSITLCGRDPQAELLANSPLAELQTGALSNQQPSQVKVSLVTSFWAEPDDVEHHPHRLEIRAALLMNILNPHFDQIVIFLDGATEDANCGHFLNGMRELSGNLGVVSVNQLDPFSRVTCVDVNTGQPTYYQMFKNAVSDHVSGDIVVLANADMAFDDTMSLARRLDPEVLVVLGTRGFTDRMPLNVKNLYHTIVGTDYMTNIIPKKKGGGGWDLDWCTLNKESSWDTWIFHKSKLGGVKGLQRHFFMRQNIKKELVPFYLNEMGAEHAGMWAVQRSYPFTSVHNACERIHSWSFHLTTKKHHERSPPWPTRGKAARVPRPWGGLKDVEGDPFLPNSDNVVS